MTIDNGQVADAEDIGNLLGLALKPTIHNAINTILNEDKSSGTNNVKPDDLYVDIFKDGSGALQFDGIRNTVNLASTDAAIHPSLKSADNQDHERDTTEYSKSGASYGVVNTITFGTPTPVEKVWFWRRESEAWDGKTLVKYYYDDATDYTEEVVGPTSNETIYQLKSSVPDSLVKNVSSIEFSIKNQSSGSATSYIKETICYLPVWSTKVLETDPATVTADPDGYYVSARNTLTGSSTINYDISFDGGSTWDTAKTLDTYYTTTKTGSSMVLQMNLTGSTSSDVATFTDYGIALTYGGVF